MKKIHLPQNNLKIVIATGIFPPDIGGPATYTDTLARELVKDGIAVKVVCYSDLPDNGGKAYPFLIRRILRKHILPFRYFLYLLALLQWARRSDLIYAMGPVSDGIPAWIASIFLRKPLVIRLGGDFVWEQSLELGKTSSPLRTFYHEPQDMFNRLLIAVVKVVLKGATRIIFSTNFQKGIYERDLRVSPEKGVVIENPVPSLADNLIRPRILREPREILFAGRLIRKNNLEILIQAFSGIIAEHKLKLRIIGDGPQEVILKRLIEKLGLSTLVTMERKLLNRDLLKEVQGAYLVVLPALTDVSPNFALECLSIGVPILLTRETGFYEKYQHQIIFFDPANYIELREKMLVLLDQTQYQQYSEVIRNLKFENTWSDVATRHLMMFSKVLN